MPPSIRRCRPKAVVRKCILRGDTVLVPAIPVIGQATGLSIAVSVVGRETVAQRRTHNVGLAAVRGVLVLRLAVHVDDVLASVPQGREHPHQVVAMRVDSVGEVEAATATLGTSDDEEIREALHMETEKGLGALCSPGLRDGATIAAHRRIE